MQTFLSSAATLLLSALLFVMQITEARAETFAGTNIDSRVIIGLSADAEAVQELLPEGWTAMPFPQGPLKGSNLLVSFVDGVLMLSADGKPLSPASRRAIILLGLAKGGGSPRIFVLRAYTTDPENDPYGVNVAADIARTNTLKGPANGGRKSTDNWTMSVPGGEMTMSLDYTTGKRSWSSSEALSYSAANTDFHRIYRYDSITDLVMSSAVGKPMTGDFGLTSSVPDLMGIFNGSETVIAILDIPVRVRKIFLP